jgi:hypothetical protein
MEDVAIGMGMNRLQRAAERDEQNAQPGKEDSSSALRAALFVWKSHN